MHVICQVYVSFEHYIPCMLMRNRQHLGPSATQMVFLLIFTVANSIAIFVLSILLARNIWLLGGNMTTIESWEVERHESLVRRAKALGGYIDGPDGVKVKITKQEFPYDIGIFRNVQQGMGGSVILWLWPFAASPEVTLGSEFETNGFEGESSQTQSKSAEIEVR